MLVIILFVFLLSLFNIYRRLSCVVKTKFTKFTFFTLLSVFILMFFLVYKFQNNFTGYILLLSFWALFFTSILSSGISEKGFIHPWQLISLLYRWEKIRKISIENKKDTVIVNFKVIRDLRQEYDKSDFEKLKKILKKNNLI